jgi:feruloyl esterase
MRKQSRDLLLQLIAALLVLLPVFAVTLSAQQGMPAGPPPPQLAPLSVVAPVTDCAKLMMSDISPAVGAKTHITSAVPVQDGQPAPYCRVLGYVEPAVKFEVRLPLATWTQRYVQTGCGGLCGQLDIRLGNDEGCYPAQHGELALASTDMGHTGGMDGRFGEKDYQLRVDFAYRGVHVTALAAKALIAAYYGRGPKFSYFSGCSDGGREALMEAQRYPQDFNGITAGAPAMNFTTQNTFYHAWNAIKNTGADGSPVLTADKLPILHQAALQACDAADGAKDGLISDPLSCHFDPAVVECKAGQPAASCLTHAQVEVARAIYRGAHDEKGDKLVLSGPLPGSELAWAGVYVPYPGDTHIMSAMISTGTLRYLAYDKNPGAEYQLKDLRFTPAAFAATTHLHNVYDATDPDLSRFRQGGGKLILWHGLADPHISPLNTIAYYTAMNQVMGAAAVKAFARLYLFPGGYHCGGGEGPFNFDLMSTIMAWVEKGSAPFALMASHEDGGPKGAVAGVPAGMPAGGLPPLPPGARPPNGLPLLPPGAQPPDGLPPLPPGAQPPDGMPPLPPGAMQSGGMPPGAQHPGTSPGFGEPSSPPVDLVRPVFPYPLTAKYDGVGSVDDPRSFTAGPAKPVVPSQLEWLGSSFYTPHYEVWCQPQGTEMNCSSKL